MPGMRAGPGGPMGHGFGGDGGIPPTAPTVAEVVERVLTRFDADDDAAVTLEEVLAELDPDGTRSTVSDAAKAAFTQVDTDSSGALTSAELSTAVEAHDGAIGVLLHGHGPHGGRGGSGGVAVADVVERALARFDADDSGSISLAELVAEFGEHGRSSTQAEADAAAVLALADANADQSISSDELGVAVAKADTDGDTLVEWAEFVALPADYALLMGVPHGPHGA